MNYILSPEQELACQAMMDGDAHSIKYFDAFTAYQAMANMLTTTVANGKKVLVHIPHDADIKEEVMQYLTTDGFDDLLIDLGSNSSIPEKDVIQMRAALKKSADIDVIIAERSTQIKSNAIRSEIAAYYAALDRTVLSDVSVANLATSLIYRSVGGQQYSLLPSDLEMSFSSEEYYNLKKEVSKASKLYQQRFELFDSLDIIDPEVWSLESGPFDGVQVQVKDDLKTALQLKSDFEETLSKIDRQQKATSNEKFAAIQANIRQLEEKLTSLHITEFYGTPESESTFSLFGRKKKANNHNVYIEAYDQLTSLIREASQPWFDQLEAVSDESIDHGYLNAFLAETKRQINHYLGALASSNTASLHRINKINTDSDDVIALDQRLDQLVTSISKNNIYTKTFENNTLSFLKQLEAAAEIAAYLHKCVILLDGDLEYLDWMKFKNSWSRAFVLTFDNLKAIPQSNWEAAMEQAFFQRIVDDVKNNNQLSIDQLQAMHDHQAKANQMAVGSLVNQLHKGRLVTAEQLRASSKEVYQTIFKKKTLPTTSWNDLALMNRDFLSDYFPIHINSDLKNLSQYDHVISWTLSKTDDFDKVVFLSPINETDLEEAHQGKHSYLYLNSYTYDQPLAQLTNSERLKASKKLAKYILSLNQDVKIYHTKAANIISLLPFYDDQQIEQRLQAYGLNTIETDGVLYDRLTESVLFTDRQPYLLVKDHLINPRLADKLEWQAMLISLFQSAGYRVLSLATSDQLLDNEAMINNTITAIMGQETLSASRHQEDQLDQEYADTPSETAKLS